MSDSPFEGRYQAGIGDHQEPAGLAWLVLSPKENLLVTWVVVAHSGRTEASGEELPAMQIEREGQPD